MQRFFQLAATELRLPRQERGALAKGIGVPAKIGSGNLRPRFFARCQCASTILVIESRSQRAIEPEELSPGSLHRRADLSGDAFEVQSLAMRAVAKIKSLLLVTRLEARSISTDGNRHGLKAFGIGKCPAFTGKGRSNVVLQGNAGQHHQEAVICFDMQRKREGQLEALLRFHAVATFDEKLYYLRGLLAGNLEFLPAGFDQQFFCGIILAFFTTSPTQMSGRFRLDVMLGMKAIKADDNLCAS